FPNGSGTFTGYTYDPWAAPGNSDGILFASLIRTSSSGTTAARVVVARSSDRGATWPKFFEATRTGMQERDMFDVDRTAALRGGCGTAQDGKVYLDVDFYSSHEVCIGSF